MSKFFAFFTKFTSWPIEHFYFKKQVYYEDPSQKHNLKGGALIVSNHKSVYDYPLVMFTFMPRHVYCLIGEAIYSNKPLSLFIKAMGNVKVSRQDKNFDFMNKTIKLLKKGNMCLIFPESRLHTLNDDPNKMLPFKNSFVHIALSANVPIIPVYTNGIYGKKKHQCKSNAKIIVGKRIYLSELMDKDLSYEQNVINITNYVQNYIDSLGKKLSQQRYQQNRRIKQIFDPKMFWHDFAKVTGSIPAIFGYRTKKIYCCGSSKKETKGSYIISSNHVTFCDPLILMTAFQSRRLCFLVAKEVYRNAGTKFWFDRFGCIRVDRQNPNFETFNKVKETLKRGHPVVVFPEAHVVQKDQKLNYQKGIVLMSIMADSPILPVYIIKRSKKIRRQVVLVGKKIYWRDYVKTSIPTLEEIDKLIKIVEERSAQLKVDYDKRHK